MRCQLMPHALAQRQWQATHPGQVIPSPCQRGSALPSWAHKGVSWSNCSGRMHRQNMAVMQASGATEGDGIVFGKPQAPQEVWEAIAHTARANLQHHVAHLHPGGEGCVVLAALEVASEDDAIKTRTHIPLPVASFSQRLDNIVGECATCISPSQPPEEQVATVMHHLFNVWGLRPSKDMADGIYSPYRVYMHQVLAQRSGTQLACAAVLHALISRLQATGALPSVQFQVGLPSSAQELPVVQLQGEGGARVMGAAGVMGQDWATQPHMRGVRWLDSREMLAEMLEQLKKAYWSWSWPLGQASGFEACAHALLGEGGRTGKVNQAVGVMQAQGRPFGDVSLALLATERMALVTGAICTDSWSHQLQVRDYAVQLLHVAKRKEGLALLTGYQAWLKEKGHEDTIVMGQGKVGMSALVDQVVLEQQRKMLEASL